MFLKNKVVRPSFSIFYKVNPNTLAQAYGLNAGDRVVLINGRDVTDITHQEAKMEITRSGNQLELTIIKYDYQSL